MIKAQAQARGLEFRAAGPVSSTRRCGPSARPSKGGAVETGATVATTPFALVSDEVRQALPQEVEDAYR
jgi:hypothetical protein